MLISDINVVTCHLEKPAGILDTILSFLQSIEGYIFLDIAHFKLNCIQYLDIFYPLNLYYLSNIPLVLYFIPIAVVIILGVILFMDIKPVPGTEGISNIPGSIRIPPTNYGEPIPENKMPGKYRPIGPPKDYPGITIEPKPTIEIPKPNLPIRL
jgi:hypothetical protein